MWWNGCGEGKTLEIRMKKIWSNDKKKMERKAENLKLRTTKNISLRKSDQNHTMLENITETENWNYAI